MGIQRHQIPIHGFETTMCTPNFSKRSSSVTIFSVSSIRKATGIGRQGAWASVPSHIQL